MHYTFNIHLMEKNPSGSIIDQIFQAEEAEAISSGEQVDSDYNARIALTSEQLAALHTSVLGIMAQVGIQLPIEPGQ